MRKDKFGIAYVAYAVLAFVLAIFGQTLALLLLLGFLIVTVQDEWTTRQAVQATGLLFVDYIVGRVFSIVKLWCGWFSPEYDTFLYNFKNVYLRIFDVIADIVDVAILVIAVIAIYNVIKQKDAQVPVVSKLADWVFGIVTVRQPAAPRPVVQPQMGAPMNPQMGAPMNPQMGTTMNSPQMGAPMNPQMNGSMGSPMSPSGPVGPGPVGPGPVGPGSVSPASDKKEDKKEDNKEDKKEDKKDSSVSLKKDDAEESKASSGKVCKKCGTVVDSGKFCFKCGAPLE